jgi:hypothetical protein
MMMIMIRLLVNPDLHHHLLNLRRTHTCKPAEPTYLPPFSLWDMKPGALKGPVAAEGDLPLKLRLPIEAALLLPPLILVVSEAGSCSCSPLIPLFCRDMMRWLWLWWGW